MLCSTCTTELADDSKFCVKCGSPVDQLALPQNTSDVLTTPTAIITDAGPPDPPPYAAFASVALGLGLCLSVVAFIAADNLAHGYWRISFVAVVCSVTAILLMLRLPVTWRRLEKYPDDLGYQKKLLRVATIFVLLFVATSAIVGWTIGKTGSETAQLIADFHEMSAIGKRISQARNSVEPDVPDYIVMYKEIEADVQSFDAVLRRLQAELPVYDDKFPQQHENTLKSIDSVNIGLKRASLLLQEIAVAKDIERLDPHPRFLAWKERMQPLLDAETSLDKTTATEDDKD
ncbi:MAG TPA: zinc ribbon domain-containing protein [Candidatus Dormibacteraeota bacterium]|nr:zinc ribbon domain-containing protein [Candidatus Dormibacteraeota bacterium]